MVQIPLLTTRLYPRTRLHRTYLGVGGHGASSGHGHAHGTGSDAERLTSRQQHHDGVGWLGNLYAMGMLWIRVGSKPSQMMNVGYSKGAASGPYETTGTTALWQRQGFPKAWTGRRRPVGVGVVVGVASR